MRDYKGAIMDMIRSFWNGNSSFETVYEQESSSNGLGTFYACCLAVFAVAYVYAKKANLQGKVVTTLPVNPLVQTTGKVAKQLLPVPQKTFKPGSNAEQISKQVEAYKTATYPGWITKPEMQEFIKFYYDVLIWADSDPKALKKDKVSFTAFREEVNFIKDLMATENRRGMSVAVPLAWMKIKMIEKHGYPIKLVPQYDEWQKLQKQFETTSQLYHALNVINRSAVAM